MLVFAAAAAPAAFDLEQELPEGPGKELVSTRCTGCHGLDTAVGPRLDRDRWSAVIAKMIKTGAKLDDRERETAVDYLSTHFGPAQSAIDPAAEQTARRYIDGICSSCHGRDLIAATRVTPGEWLQIVKNMNGKGAGLSEADVDLLADYLARTYPAD